MKKSAGILLWGLIFILITTTHLYAGTVRYTYDKFGYLQEATQEEFVSMTYEYDAIGNRLAKSVSIMTSAELSILVETDSNIPLSSLKIHAFTETGSYTGVSSITDELGKAFFEPDQFKEGMYKFRIDYMGQQFWSESIHLPSLTILHVIIAEEHTDIFVTVGGEAVEDITVYLFNENGSYLNLHEKTDNEGKVSFNLPSGKKYKFRSDYMGTQYWSDAIEILEDAPNTVSLATGGGILHINLQRSAGEPISEVPLYLFSSSDTYLGLNQLSDENGDLSFRVSDGEYKIRADYMGYQFWSELISVQDDTSFDMTLPHQDQTITIQGDYNGDIEPKEHIPFYLFSSSDSYIGINKSSDVGGMAVFTLPEQEYKIRADYLSMQFWSDPFIWSDALVSIKEGIADITVTNLGAPLAGISVYTFSQDGSYLGLTETTDETGSVQFRLPQGTYNFRADFMGNQYWSGERTITGHLSNPIPLSTGGGNFSLTLLDNSVTPLTGFSCYLFSESGSYLGESAATNDQGEVEFNIADGTYKIRVDYLRYQFWSDTFQIPEDSDMSLSIPHQDVMLTVRGDYNGDVEPRTDLDTYLFTPTGSYLGQNQKTDGQGNVVYHLPEKEYQIRIDTLSRQYWSDTIFSDDTAFTLQEGMAEVVVKQGTTPLEGVNVYLFSEADAYLGIKESTNSSGIAQFRLSQGSYKFRADTMGAQYWGTQTIAAHDITPVEINTGGGSFVLTVEKTSDEPLTGTPVYVFNDAGSYLGLSGQTGDLGTISFDLSDGAFSFRADYMGYQFWTETVSVPDTLTATLTIPHEDITVTVHQVYGTVSEPIESCKVYLFTESGSYQGESGETDAQGQIRFNVPFESYKARVDFMGRQYWTDPMNWSDETVNVNYGSIQLQVTQNEIAIENATVYLFSESDSYLGQSAVTDESGVAGFTIPEGDYKFRVDYDGNQYWKESVSVHPHLEESMEIELSE